MERAGLELGDGAGPHDRDDRPLAAHEPGRHHLVRGRAQLGRDLAQDSQPSAARLVGRVVVGRRQGLVGAGKQVACSCCTQW